MVMIVTVLLLTLEYLFRASLFLTLVPDWRGLTQAEFGATSAADALPLLAAFAPVFLLLLAWQVTLFWTLGRQLSIAGKVIGAANSVLIVALGLSMWGSLDPIWTEKYYASGAGDWNVSESWLLDGRESQAEAARPFLGRWRVDSFERLGSVGPSRFPYRWAEVPKDGTWFGWTAATAQAEHQFWAPPIDSYPGQWVLDRADGSPVAYVLQPKIDGAHLVLLSDEEYPGPRFRVRLVRVGDSKPWSGWPAALEPWPAYRPR